MMWKTAVQKQDNGIKEIKDQSELLKIASEMQNANVDKMSTSQPDKEIKPIAK